jgi:uncharacterized membrane protein
MKLFVQLILISSAALVLSTGCRALTSGTASPTSIPVTQGVASTNDSQVVAVLKEAQALNQAANPTPYEPLINDGLSGLIMLASAFGGWMLRHTTAKAQIAAAQLTAPKL